MNNNKKIIIIALLCALVLGYYTYLTNKTNTGRTTTNRENEYNRLIEYDFASDYPNEPREVIEMYSDMMYLAYNDKLEGDDLKKMNHQMRELCDEELLSQQGNSEEEQLALFAEDIKKHDSDLDKISSYKLAGISQVEYGEVEGDQCALIQATYSISFYNPDEGKKGFNKITENYVLRQNENKEWKILGWQSEKNGDAQELEEEK